MFNFSLKRARVPEQKELAFSFDYLIKYVNKLKLIPHYLGYSCLDYHSPLKASIIRRILLIFNKLAD